MRMSRKDCFDRFLLASHHATLPTLCYTRAGRTRRLTAQTVVSLSGTANQALWGVWLFNAPLDGTDTCPGQGNTCPPLESREVTQ